MIGRVVGRDVADAGPRPQDAQVAQERQQPGDLVRVAAQRGERRLARVRRLRVELGADEHLAALGLRDVAGELGAGEDGPEALRVVVGDEGVERVGADRQPDAGRGAAMRVTRPPTADRTTPAAIGPPAVSTPVTRPPSPSRRSPVTGVCWRMSTPRWDAPAAKAQATRSWRAVAPSTWCDAPSTG